MPTKPGYTTALALTDAAQTNVVVQTYCAAVYVAEQSTAAGWPRTFLVKGPMAGSAQLPQTPGAAFRFPGPYAPGDIAGTLELASAGGDSSVFNVLELAS
jgi:hypothetical protein